MRQKITVIGDGQVVGVAALLLAQRDYAEVVLVDGDTRIADDLAVTGAVAGYDSRVRAGGWPDAAGADVVVLTRVTEEACAQLADRCPGAVAIVATADVPADVDRMLDATRWPRGRVVGLAGMLDDARLRLDTARREGISVRDAKAAPDAGSDGWAPGPYALAAAIAEVTDAVLLDRPRVLQCTVACHGEHGHEGVTRAAVRLGREGVEEILAS